ncbi:MAG: hypothetical protein WAT93_12520 [Pontixanthobacter sp.]
MGIDESRNWAINTIAEMDIRHAGLAGHFLRSSHERKQVITAYLAHVCIEAISDQSITALSYATHDEILRLALGNVPSGLRGALSRSLPKSHPKTYYRLLVAILRAVSESERQALSHQQNLDLDFLERWSLVPSELREPSFLSIFKDTTELEELLFAVEVLEKAGLCRATIISRISNVSSVKNLSVAVRALLAMLEFPKPPLSGNATICAVSNVAELNTFARKLRNCSASLIFDVLDGRAYFYVIHPESPEAMVHLEFEDGKWIINDIVGKVNRPVSREVGQTVFDYFESQGVHRSVSCRPSSWDAVRHFCRFGHGMI